MPDHTYASAMAEAIHEAEKVVNAAEHGHDVLITATESLSQLRYLQQQEKNQRAYAASMLAHKISNEISNENDLNTLNAFNGRKADGMVFDEWNKEQEHG